MTKPLHIMFAGGGTGGHLFPGLAVAREVARRLPDLRITFCGTGKDWECNRVAEAGLEYRVLPAAPLVASPMALLRALYSNGVGYRAACRLIVSDPPTVVVGLGGYSSVPLAVAAARQGVPLVLLEQNVIPGRANRWLARWAATVCVSFEDAVDQLSMRPQIVVTGNPVRAEIIEASAARAEHANQSRDADPLLVVLGGSQGAHSINRFVTESLSKLTDFLADWQIVHQTGAKDVAWVRAAYDAHRLRAEVVPFISDMADVYRRATLAVARAGATTLAEMAIAGVPAILLPYPFATANHQWHNAQAFGRAGAAIVVDDRPEPGRTTAALVSALAPLLRLPELRREMRLAMLKLARPDAVEAVVTAILTTTGTDQLARQSA
jgi:UDP-N-acetylglucosamine--N-acetylmuramyl-(pentapeptide) pyrophosphoryl-undecaprenol N-acetylglucosamine transferase